MAEAGTITYKGSAVTETGDGGGIPASGPLNPGINVTMIGNSTPTVISGVSFTKILGTTDVAYLSSIAGFSTPADNRILYSGEAACYLVICTANIKSATSAADVTLAIGINGIIDAQTHSVLSVNNTETRQATSMTIQSISDGDYFEAFIQSATAQNYIVTDMSITFTRV